ncbi:MAG: alpha/beta fold hydrolase [SAR202 cluster bacterium]|nr:alpha/beta fold hydrolase [SAR202 cluster bacterium]
MSTAPSPVPPGYFRHYSTEGPPVVLVGEILGGYASWGAHADALGSRWRVMAVSPLLVTHAAQGRLPPEPWGVHVEGDALAAGLDSLGIDTAHVAGWSLGGAIAIDFAMSHPGRVRSLTLVEPQVRWLLRALGRETDADRADSSFIRGLGEREIDEAVLSHFLHRVGAVPPDEDPTRNRAWRLAWQHRLALANAWRVQANEDDVERLRALTMPLLLVRGDRTNAYDTRMTDALAELLPAARRLLLPGGHTSHIASMPTFIEAFEATLLQGEARRG